MKITAFFLFLGIFFAHAGGSYSQGTNLTLNLHSATIREVCEQIEKQSNYIFVFSDNVENELNKKIDISSNSENIEDLLENVFSSTRLTYKILDKQIVVYHANEKEKEIIAEPSPAPQQEQTKTITGKVTDQSGEPLPGATVMVKGSTIGTVTDSDGNFSLRIPMNAQTLQVSFVGMKTQEIPIGNRTTFNIVLEEVATGLEELIVVGYGIQKKESSVGAISQVDGETLKKMTTVSLSNALTGQLPGVFTLQNDAKPGADEANVFIRGKSSWVDNAPLILVDGAEVEDFNDIDPNEVETISVLKDASATAVFGVKGANGVILITTKRGKEGKIKFTFNSEFGLKNPLLKRNMYDSYATALIVNEA